MKTPNLPGTFKRAARWLFLSVFFPALFVQAQYTPPPDSTAVFFASSAPLRQFSATDFLAPERGYSPLAKLRQRNYGAQLGFQRGAYSYLEMGVEHHWRKISLTKPTMLSVGGSFGYNFWDNLAEYKAGFWYKWGRIALTYGGNLVYATDFKKGRIGVAPVAGFRLLGFHLTTGYNFLWGDDEFDRYNNFYVSLRYFFQVDNKFTWKKKNKNGRNKKDKDRKKINWPWKKD